MTWLELVENPEAVNALFEAAPSLADVEILRVVLERDGPTVVVEVALNEAPSRLSPRFEKTGANAVTLRLQLLGVESLSIEGWGSENRARIDVQPGVGAKIAVTIIGDSSLLNCNCTWLRVAGVTPYRRESHS
jgi:hypothetical protein